MSENAQEKQFKDTLKMICEKAVEMGGLMIVATKRHGKTNAGMHILRTFRETEDYQRNAMKLMVFDTVLEWRHRFDKIPFVDLTDIRFLPLVQDLIVDVPFVDSQITRNEIGEVIMNDFIHKRKLKEQLKGDIPYVNIYVIEEIQNCYDGETEVLTKDGWKYFKDLTNDDEVATLSKDNYLEYQKPTRIIRQNYNGTMYFYNGSRSINFGVTQEHDMVFESKDGIKKSVIEKIPNRFLIPLTAKWKGRDAKDEDYKKYLKFLGLWIAEGHKTKYTVEVTQKTHVEEFEKIIKDFVSLFNIHNFHYSKRLVSNGITKFRINSKELSLLLPNSTSSNSKYIPHHILELSPEYLQALFEGLMLGDGSYRKRYWTYWTVSKELAEQIGELATKIGYTVSVSKHIPSNPKHQISYAINGTINSKRIKKTVDKNKIKKRQYNGMVYCVTVPNGIIFVRREKGKTSRRTYWSKRGFWCGNCLGTYSMSGAEGRFWLKVVSECGNYGQVIIGLGQRFADISTRVVDRTRYYLLGATSGERDLVKIRGIGGKGLAEKVKTLKKGEFIFFDREKKETLIVIYFPKFRQMDKPYAYEDKDSNGSGYVKEIRLGD